LCRDLIRAFRVIRGPLFFWLWLGCAKSAVFLNLFAYSLFSRTQLCAEQRSNFLWARGGRVLGAREPAAAAVEGGSAELAPDLIGDLVELTELLPLLVGKERLLRLLRSTEAAKPHPQQSNGLLTGHAAAVQKLGGRAPDLGRDIRRLGQSLRA